MRSDSHRQAIHDFVRERRVLMGKAPSCREAGEAVGISGVAAWKHFQALIAEGKLVKKRNGSIDLPASDVAQDCSFTDYLTRFPTDALRGELARRGATFDALETPKLLPNEGRPCAANFCQERIERGKLFCREHWYGLPPSMRSAIMNAWRARDVQAYSEALEAARDYLGGFTRVVERVG